MPESIHDFPEGTVAKCVQCREPILLDQREGGGPAKDWGARPENWVGNGGIGMDYGCAASPLNDDEGTGGHSPKAGTIRVPEETPMRIIDNEPERSGRNRSIDFTWELQDLGDGAKEQLVLSASHDSERKCFFASLGQQKRAGSRVSFEIFGGVTLAREPVARFSQKRLDEFAGSALATLRGTDDDKVEALLVPSDRSCGCKGMHHEAGCEVYAASVRAKNRGAR